VTVARQQARHLIHDSDRRADELLRAPRQQRQRHVADREAERLAKTAREADLERRARRQPLPTGTPEVILASIPPIECPAPPSTQVMPWT
jgi:hypothetical protein